MTVDIISGDEELVAEKLRDGGFRSLEELVHHALAALPSGRSAARPSELVRPEGKKSLPKLFAASPLKGLAMDFERFRDTSSGL